MSKKTIISAVAALVVLALAVGGLIYNKQMKERPGTHLFDGELYVHLDGVGYSFALKDGKLGDFQSETPVKVSGGTKGGEDFEGELSVLGYPITESGTISGTPAAVPGKNGFYEIHWNPSCTHTESVTETNAEGETVSSYDKKVNHFCNYQYIFVVHPDHPDFAAVYVHNIVKDANYVVILADSEDQAKELYHWMKETEK